MLAANCENPVRESIDIRAKMLRMWDSGQTGLQ
jgi:hypothetical protein